MRVKVNGNIFKVKTLIDKKKGGLCEKLNIEAGDSVEYLF